MALGEATIPWLPVQPSGRIFSRSRINDSGLGPSHPFYHILTDSAIQDIVEVVKDDFWILDTALWRGSLGTANFAIEVDTPEGRITANMGADEDSMLTTATGQLNVNVDHRPVILGRIKQRIIVNSKFEFGFAEEAFNADGCVNVKATPSSTGSDYAMIIRDTDNNTEIDLICDNVSGDNDGPIADDSGNTTMVLDTYMTLMLNLNEQNEARYWINGAYIDAVTTGVPDGGQILAPCVYGVDRDAAATAQIDIDYIKVWQERVVTL